MSVCSTCLTTLDDFYRSKHFALNLISKLTHNTVTNPSDFKKITPMWMSDITKIAEMGKLYHHSQTEDELFVAFKSRFDHLKDKPKSILVKWLENQWYGDTHQKFLNIMNGQKQPD